MHTDDFDRLERIFHAAAELAEDARAEFLDRECGDDSELRQRVDKMLAHLDRGESLAGAGASAIEDDGAGAVIGRYKLLQVIGEGGFGVVYMAEQQEPVIRKVALKVIKLGMDSKEIVARFEAERQALALMDHPNIAQVLDGGTTDNGRPYFVMELVRGVSITEYCDQQNLPPRARLELFMQVCHAVQHAHQKGVIHRDLKPSNVMVTLHDGKPVPKVIDFGIAKAMHTRLTEKTLFTEYQRFIGTPAYMSPEQAEMSALDVDTRADIYSLGVLLYELLTGTTPFDTRKLLEAGLGEIQRHIREVQPPRPSMRISSAGDADIASRRSLDRAALSRAVRGDLDWIVMRALEKERGRRYGTASDFAADVQRHLDQRPVEAGPPSARYRIQKYVSRNRAWVTGGALLLLLLVGGVIGTTLGMVEASHQRDVATKENLRSASMLAFLTDTLALTDPEVTLEPDLTVRDLLDNAAKRIDATFADDIASEANVRSIIGRAYASLGEFETSERHMRRAIALADQVPDFDKFELYTTVWALTEVVFRLDRYDAFAIAFKARMVGNEILGVESPALARALGMFVQATQEVSSRHEAPSRFRTAHARASEVLPRTDRRWLIVADAFMAGAYGMWYTPHEPSTVPIIESAIEIYRRVLPVQHPDRSDAELHLAGVLCRAGAPEVGERVARSCLAQMREMHDPDHWRIGFAESVLGECLLDQAKFAEAETTLLSGHARLLETWDEKNFYGSESFARLAKLYEVSDRVVEGAPYRTALCETYAFERYVFQWGIARSCFPPGPLRDALDALHTPLGFEVAGSTVEGDDSDEAVLARAEAVVAARRASLADSELLSLVTARGLLTAALSISFAKRADTRRVLLEECARIFALHADRIPTDAAEARIQLARLAHRDGDGERALRLAREGVEILGAASGVEDWVYATAKIRMARVLRELGLDEEAAEIATPAHATIVSQVGATHVEAENARAFLHELFTAMGRTSRARDYAPATTDSPSPQHKD